MNKVSSKQAVSFWYPVLIEVALFIILVASLSNVVCRDENHGHVINLPEFLFQDFGFICLLLEDIEPSYLSPGFHIPIQVCWLGFSYPSFCVLVSLSFGSFKLNLVVCVANTRQPAWFRLGSFVLHYYLHYVMFLLLIWFFVVYTRLLVNGFQAYDLIPGFLIILLHSNMHCWKRESYIMLIIWTCVYHENGSLHNNIAKHHWENNDNFEMSGFLIPLKSCVPH